MSALWAVMGACAHITRPAPRASCRSLTRSHFQTQCVVSPFRRGACSILSLVSGWEPDGCPKGSISGDPLYRIWTLRDTGIHLVLFGLVVQNPGPRKLRRDRSSSPMTPFSTQWLCPAYFVLSEHILALTSPRTLAQAPEGQNRYLTLLNLLVWSKYSIK